ncbi:phage-like protein [Enterobacter hormaechei]|uniref:phage-like protein n=2 Tax=Enterobacter TaxID=547 RepID=UPI0005EDCA27|nr:phage-like protein [Enterobacter hormaechei subsp. steigerwaltii]KOQ80979.1 phage-like protein [Enterobacter hormaechei]KOQ86817.1 phage-like protein [Enterobacter hormaechei]
MKERGMIFNGEMVRAILDGRKTQTRRIMKIQPSDGFHPTHNGYDLDLNAHWYTPGVVDKNGYLQPAKKDVFGVADENEGYTCPFGAVGDRIWVREAFQGPLVSEEFLEEYRAYPEKFENPEYCEYAADGGPRPEYCDLDDNLRHGWRPSIHMPRWASRLTLEITSVRVERLRDLSEDDAKSEGITPPSGGVLPGWEYRINFRELWMSIYGSDNLEANPWVWVIEFKVVPNVPANSTGSDLR